MKGWGPSKKLRLHSFKGQLSLILVLLNVATTLWQSLNNKKLTFSYIYVCMYLYITHLRKQNARCFEDCERSILDIKFFFFRNLLEWSLVSPSYSCFSLFLSLILLIVVIWVLDLCHCSTLPVYLVGFFYNKISYVTY